MDALIDGDWDSPAIHRGNHVHDMLENMALYMTKGMTAVEAAEAVHESDAFDGYLKPPAAASYLERAIPVFELIKPKKGGVEAWFKDAQKLPIIGKIDLQSSTTPVFGPNGLPVDSREEDCVLDHKTIGNPARMKGAHEAKKSLQLRIYCLATGMNTGGFIYYLPSGPVRGVVVTFTDAELALTREWLRLQLDVIDSRWERAKELSGSDTTAPDIGGYNLQPFSLAEPGHGLCSPKWCDHWAECLGKKSPSKKGQERPPNG